MMVPQPHTPLHRLLQAQIEKAMRPDGLHQDELLTLISEAYSEQDQARMRVHRANRLMAEEIEEQTKALHTTLREVGLQNLRFQAALDNMPQGIGLFDADGRLIVCNRTFRNIYNLGAELDITGQKLSEFLPQSPALVTPGLHSLNPTSQQLIMSHIALPTSGASPIEQLWPDGRTIRIHRCSVDDGGYLDMVWDVTETHAASARIVHMANYDALTDLPNRTLFRERLGETVADAQRRHAITAVMCLALDRFKAVNDTLGHPVGDALLIGVAHRLRDLMRGDDLAARLSGDEFGVLIDNARRVADVHKLADRLIRRLSLPYEIHGHQVLIGVSIGIEFIEPNSPSADVVLRNAALALNQAKLEGRGRACVFAPELHTQLDERRQLELDLRRALKKDEFLVYYQPQISVKGGEVSGFEALVRWKSPTRGMVPPLEFIPLSEETGLIDDLGALVLKRACQAAKTLPAHLTMAVNLSPVQFRSRRLVGLVAQILRETGLDPARLELEVTESVMIQDAREALQTLRALKDMGVRISLDDFGTGYSSLSYIRHFPFDKIKIDQSFVRDLGQTTDSLAIIRAVSGICTSLGICSVAEGVETDAQFQILKAEACDNLQGYLFGRPVPLAETAQFYSPCPTLRAS